jgi:hypothetical protein
MTVRLHQRPSHVADAQLFSCFRRRINGLETRLSIQVRIGRLLYESVFGGCIHPALVHLAYESQRESPSNRAMRRAQRIRMRLGGTANMFLPLPVKPKGMHWLTYQRLRREEAEANAQSWPLWLSPRTAAEMKNAFPPNPNVVYCFRMGFSITVLPS